MSGCPYTGYERTNTSLQQSAISEAGDNTYLQGDLFTTGTLPAGSKAQSLKDTFLVSTKSEVVREVKVGLTKVTTPEEAAHVVSAFRNNTQETMLLVVTDSKGEVLEIVRHTVGAKDSSAIYLADLATVSLFNLSSIDLISFLVTLSRGIPFGRYCRIKPL